MYFLSLSTSVPDFVNKGNCFWLLLLSQYRLCAYQVKQNHIMTKNFTEVLCVQYNRSMSNGVLSFVQYFVAFSNSVIT